MKILFARAVPTQDDASSIVRPSTVVACDPNMVTISECPVNSQPFTGELLNHVTIPRECFTELARSMSRFFVGIDVTQGGLSDISPDNTHMRTFMTYLVSDVTDGLALTPTMVRIIAREIRKEEYEGHERTFLNVFPYVEPTYRILRRNLLECSDNFGFVAHSPIAGE